MSKEVFEQLKNESKMVLFVLIFSFIALKIAFYDESFVNTLRTTISLFWLFLAPGYIFMFIWHDKLNFTERIVIGTIVSIAITGVLGYYFGIWGLNVNYHMYLIPFVISIPVLFYFKKFKVKHEN